MDQDQHFKKQLSFHSNKVEALLWTAYITATCVCNVYTNPFGSTCGT